MNSALIKEFLVKVELFDTFDETELNLVANLMKLKGSRKRYFAV